MFCPKCGGTIPPSESENLVCPSCGWQLSDGFLAHLSKPNEDITTQTAEKEKKQKKHGNKKNSRLKITAIVLVCAVLISGIASIIYYNSASYKVKKATDLIMNGELDDGLAVINNVYTPQATITKKYVEQVDRAKEDFLAVRVKGNEENTRQKYETLVTNFSKFKEENPSEIYHMPEGIKKKYDCIDSALTFISKYISFGSPSQLDVFACLYDVQLVMLNEVERKRSSKTGSTYNLGVFQERINTSKDALKILESFEENDYRIEITDSAVISNCITSSENNKHYVRVGLGSTLRTLSYECSDEIEKSQENIDETLEEHKEFNMDSQLFLISGNDPTYTSYVGADFNRITTDTQIYENQNKIIEKAEVQVFYALIRG